MKRFLPIVFALFSSALLAAVPPVNVEVRRVPERGIKPSVVADARGVLHLIYFSGEPAAGDALYAMSKDGGATWSQAVPVNSQAGSVLSTQYAYAPETHLLVKEILPTATLVSGGTQSLEYDYTYDSNGDLTQKKTVSKKRPTDVNELAHFLGAASTKERPAEKGDTPSRAEISRVMAELGRRGGKVGGKKRMETLTQEQRSQIAYKAAQARWGKKARKP